ncbi:FAD-dependent oxidoreductase [Luteolibacter algae]|uniref:FAD-dependent oxidoreductase n=1 Tax=Luteolibacter algae TaxID=454151 RepID=A0ABW5D8K6_9BACT
MKIFEKEAGRRLKQDILHADLVVTGGGLAGVCAAITAAREGMKVVLVQDRPVLGGNASSEVRLWALGATSHLGNNNRWSREGGVMGEILVENLYRNPEGNANLLDALLLDKVLLEPAITLLLDTAVNSLRKNELGHISEIGAFCSQNSTCYTLAAPLFIDASGDGILGFLSGASYRIGAEAASEFDEAFAPDEEYGGLLGHSMYFYSRDTGKPVSYVAPSFALKDITKIPRYKNFKAGDTGCQLWWLEHGGRLDTIHDTRQIKQDLLGVIYGVWDYIKNSGNFPEAENLTLEWVGNVPGKRESRRFVGDYMLSQKDVIEQRCFKDAVAYGGWAIDLHPGDGVFSKLNGCTQWHSKGVYQIPYRTMYSRDIPNLFLAGRIISATHVAFGSTRVMATTGHSAQAVGMAAAICAEKGILPRDVLGEEQMGLLQRRLTRTGHYIPFLDIEDPENLASKASANASSTFELHELTPGADRDPLDRPRAMLVPCKKGSVPPVTFYLDVESGCEIEAQLRISSRSASFTPDITLETCRISVPSGKTVPLEIAFQSRIEHDQYVFLCLMPVEGVSVITSDQRVTGVLSVSHSGNDKVARSSVQEPPAGIGVDRVEFWLPQRRPGGKNFALKFAEPIHRFEAAQVLSGPQRPSFGPNAWVAAAGDKQPSLKLKWQEAIEVKTVALFFDTDFDHPMETVQMGHPEREMPFCVKDFDLIDGDGKIIHEARDNHSTRYLGTMPEGMLLAELTVRVLATHGAPAAIFQIQCF